MELTTTKIDPRKFLGVMEIYSMDYSDDYMSIYICQNFCNHRVSKLFLVPPTGNALALEKIKYYHSNYFDSKLKSYLEPKVLMK